MEGHMKPYAQYCPISRALDLLGERWSLLIIRDMLMGGATRFNEIARGLPGLSRSLLSRRLKQFEQFGLIEQVDGQYLLTDAGEDLRPVVIGLGTWGARWLFDEPDPDELDAVLLVWWMHARLDVSDLPGKRHVIHMRFSDDPTLFWIVVENDVPSVCLDDPGYEVDVTISTDRSTLYQVWLGHLPLRAAMKSGKLQATGTAAYRRRLGEILRLSPAAPIVVDAGKPARGLGQQPR